MQTLALRIQQYRTRLEQCREKLEALIAGFWDQIGKPKGTFVVDLAQEDKPMDAQPQVQEAVLNSAPPTTLDSEQLFRDALLKAAIKAAQVVETFLDPETKYTSDDHRKAKLAMQLLAIANDLPIAVEAED